jgi:hypothetical protein
MLACDMHVLERGGVNRTKIVLIQDSMQYIRVRYIPRSNYQTSSIQYGESRHMPRRKRGICHSSK